MGLTGTLRDGTRIEAIPHCEFEAPRPNSRGEICACDEEAWYRVSFATGEVLHACEEHAQVLWDTDEALAQTVDVGDNDSSESVTATNAVRASAE